MRRRVLALALPILIGGALFGTTTGNAQIRPGQEEPRDTVPVEAADTVPQPVVDPGGLQQDTIPGDTVGAERQVPPRP